LTWSAVGLGLALLAPGALAELKPGAKIPNPSVVSTAGKTQKLAQLRGNSPAIVNFFASW
jgi:hypothetical protein